jgi:hypothetical protein
MVSFSAFTSAERCDAQPLTLSPSLLLVLQAQTTACPLCRSRILQAKLPCIPAARHGTMVLQSAADDAVENLSTSSSPNGNSLPGASSPFEATHASHDSNGGNSANTEQAAAADLTQSM